jgi:hypothetical protein
MTELELISFGEDKLSRHDEGREERDWDRREELQESELFLRKEEIWEKKDPNGESVYV